MKNLKLILLSTLLFFSFHLLHAQSAKWDWVQNGSNGKTNGNFGIIGCVVDASKNSYVCGDFKDTVIFGSGAHAVTVYAEGDDDIFIAKYDMSGALVWVKTAGTSSYDEVNNISLDKKGHIFVSGYFNIYYKAGEKFNFGNNISITSDSVYDIFIACYDTSGTVKWATVADGSPNQWGLSSDSIGNCVLTGSNNYLPNTPGIDHTSKIFVDLFDSTGKIAFSDTITSDGLNFSGGFGGATVTSVTWDINHNFYITGGYTYDITIDGKTHLASTLSPYQLTSFLVKYGTNYQVQWIKYFEEEEGGANLYNVGSDRNGNLYVTGDYWSNYNKSSFLDADGVKLAISDTLKYHSFIGSYNMAGKSLWMKDIGLRYLQPAVNVDSGGNFFFVGEFLDTISYGATLLTSRGNADVFVSKYNNMGKVQWAVEGGSTGMDVGRHICSNSSGSIIFSGTYSGDTAWFGNMSITHKSNTGNFFLAFLSYDTSTGIKLPVNGDISFHIYPNPFSTTLTLTASGLSPADGNISIMDLQGREVYRAPCAITRNFTTQIDLSPLSSGLYILKITSAYDTYTVKVSKM